MKRSWIIMGGAVGVLLIGILFLIFRDKTPGKEEDIFSENPVEEPINENIESAEQVLESMPKQPDFNSITETIFLNEGVEEAKIFESITLVQLEELQKIGKEVKVLLEKKALNWCVPISNASFVSTDPDRLMTDEGYREALEEEREIRDAKLLSNAFQEGDAWGLWLVRLTESVQKEDKKKEQAVEKFQEQFNEITDAYEELLYESSREGREKIDQIIFAQKDIALLPQNLFNELDRPLTEELGLCREGKMLESLQYQTVSRMVATWEKKVATVSDAQSKVQSRIVDVSPTLMAKLSTKTGQYTTDFERAFTEMQAVLQE